MGWGALMGLGEGLQKAGGIITENAKTKLLDKLEKEKEARADQRDIAREQRAEIRDNNKPVGTTIEPGPDGVLMAVTKNAMGHTLDSRLASQEEIRQHNFEVQKDNASLEALTLGLDVKRKEAANWDNDHSLDTRYKESLIGYNQARGSAAITRADGSGQPQPMTPEEGASYLVKQYPTVVTSARNAGVQEWEIQQLAASVMKEASSPEDAKSRFADTLRILARNKKLTDAEE